MVKMSEAYKHMSAYEKLTDSIVDVILMSTKEELTEAKSLINRIYKRQLYKSVGRTAPNKNISNIEEKLLQNEKGFGKDDFRVQKLSFNYGKGPANPIKCVYFYRKDGYECYKGKDPEETSLFLPSGDFQEEIVLVYSTSLDDKKTNKLSWKWDIIKIMEDAKKIIEDAKDALEKKEDKKNAMKIIGDAKDAMKKIEEAKDALEKIEETEDALKQIKDAKGALKIIENARDDLTKRC